MKKKYNKKDMQWLKALSGNPDKKGDRTLNVQAKIFKGALDKSHQEDLTQPSIFNDDLKEKIKSNLIKEGLYGDPSPNFITKWIKEKIEIVRLFIVSILSILLGLMIPVQMATRGYHDQPAIESRADVISSEITLNDSYPITFAKLIIQRSIESGMVAKVSGSLGEKDNEKIELIIYGFKAMDINQTRLKLILKSNNQLEGNVKVTIKKESKGK
jgi:hypothetical protein